MLNVEDIMTTDLETLPADASVDDAARVMRDADIGDVIVINDDGSLAGLVTDRDITIRAVASGRDPASTALDEVCSDELLTIAPDDSVEDAIELMRTHAVRRLPSWTATDRSGSCPSATWLGSWTRAPPWPTSRSSPATPD